MAIIVMGVSGSGKSTLGVRLAEALDCPFLEGDDFHAADAVAKMRAGIALTDEDRWPWLDRLGGAMDAAVTRRGLAVAACSALRRRYRARLAVAIAAPTRFILLDTARSELERRLADRPGHFMPPSLLDSQIETLERPGDEEGAKAFDSSLPLAALCRDVVAWLATVPHSGTDAGH